ncbi:MAG: outer membrane beta-barrel protein [Taibaiella sp.]|nr:outer membrane beta-barrel protein [Taibaiella sp.]
MDNRNVHIDELFQHRFENESDREHIHQSWKKMELLLDGEKGKRRIVFWKGFNWLIPGFLITLIATIGVGYWWNKNHVADDASITSQDRTSSSDNADQVISMLPDGQDRRQSVRDRNAEGTSRKELGNETSHTMGLHKDQTSQSYTTAQRLSPKLSEQPAAAPGQKSTSSSPLVGEQSGSSDKKKVSGHPIVIDDKGQVYAGSATQIGAKMLGDHKIKSGEEQEIIQQLEEAIENKVLVVDKNDKTIKKVETVQVKGLEINQKMIKDNTTQNKMLVLHDTVGFKEVSKNYYIPLSMQEIRALQGLALTQDPIEGQYDLVRIERFHNASDQDLQLLSAANTSGSSKILKSEDAKKNSILKDVNNFFEIRKNFYTTVFGGLNVSTNTFFPIGFQAGLGLHYWMGSRWSVGAELGYSYRPMEYTFTDESVINTQNGPGIPVSNGMMYNYKEEKNSNVYNFKYLNTVELPLLFTYHGDRWSFFGGPSLNFASKLRYQKLSSSSSLDKMVVLEDAESFGDVMKNTGLQSRSDDFDPTIGVGLNLGARYALTDRIGLTATYSQVLYDNAKTNIGQQFSKEMLRIPSFRIGITYRLNNDKKVKYMMGK